MKRTAPDELNDSLAKRPKVVSSPMPGQQMYHAQTMGTPAHYMPPPNAVPRVPGYTELPQNVQESLASSEDPFFDSPQLPPICGFLMEGATGHQYELLAQLVALQRITILFVQNSTGKECPIYADRRTTQTTK